MGLEMPEEFRPITTIRTVSTARLTSFSYVSKISDSKKTQELNGLDNEEECQTPKSAESTLILVCPPAPSKARPPKRKLCPPPQGFFEVPHDLASLFFSLNTPSKKIRPI
ncbi:hypothetical protein CFOL_v3_03249 [Cephalotus follicularis]|uniref:Uncharacterized protein n=1 Tax=Cephalotus follicularis TaxID=3775 RepID=A0A1Q3AVG9_CEPFO|nr:hypothetical protein CFOL_v3_03249 [Cephalotus follicularis]